MFASGRPEIGQNTPTAKLYAQTLPREAWADPSAGLDLSAIKNLVAVHRLREVSCLYGFTRFEAAPTSADGELEDVRLAVHGAPITQNADWLPAIEQFGEGIFIHFDEAAIAEWLGKDAAKGGTTSSSVVTCIGAAASWAKRRAIPGRHTCSCTAFRTR